MSENLPADRANGTLDGPCVATHTEPTPQGATMATRKPANPNSDWAKRKENYKSISVRRELASQLLILAEDADQSIADLIDTLIRETVEEKYRLVLEKKLARLKGDTPARRRRVG